MNCDPDLPSTSHNQGDSVSHELSNSAVSSIDTPKIAISKTQCCKGIKSALKPKIDDKVLNLKSDSAIFSNERELSGIEVSLSQELLTANEVEDMNSGTILKNDSEDRVPLSQELSHAVGVAEMNSGLISESNSKAKDCACEMYDRSTNPLQSVSSEILCFLKNISILSIAKVMFTMWIGYTMIQIKKSQDKILSLESKILDHINGTIEIQDFYHPSDCRNETNAHSLEFVTFTQDTSLKDDTMSPKVELKNESCCEANQGTMLVCNEIFVFDASNQQQEILQQSNLTFKFDDQSLKAAVYLWFRNSSECEEKYGIMGLWDTSKVTNMQKLFKNRKLFNEDISKWDVSKVTDMSGMFYGASSFNQQLSTWNVSMVTSMSWMFWGASAFNQSLSTWNVSKVSSTALMFYGASAFSQPLEPWDMYPNMWIRNAMKLWLIDRPAAVKKYGKIEDWDTSKVTSMSWLLDGYGNTDGSLISKFNEDISKWDVSMVTDMTGMFWGASSFNQSLSTWNVSSVTSMSYMFWGASAFNQSLSSWSVAKVRSMIDMFDGANSFDIPISAPWYHE